MKQGNSKIKLIISRFAILVLLLCPSIANANKIKGVIEGLNSVSTITMNFVYNLPGYTYTQIIEVFPSFEYSPLIPSLELDSDPLHLKSEERLQKRLSDGADKKFYEEFLLKLDTDKMEKKMFKNGIRFEKEDDEVGNILYLYEHILDAA